MGKLHAGELEQGNEPAPGSTSVGGPKMSEAAERAWMEALAALAPQHAWTQSGTMSPRLRRALAKPELREALSFEFAAGLAIQTFFSAGLLDDAPQALAPLRALLAMGASPEARCHARAPSPMASALGRENVGALRLLIQAGADPNGRAGFLENLPLPFLAIEYGKPAMLAELFKLGADPRTAAPKADLAARGGWAAGSPEEASLEDFARAHWPQGLADATREAILTAIGAARSDQEARELARACAPGRSKAPSGSI